MNGEPLNFGGRFDAGQPLGDATGGRRAVAGGADRRAGFGVRGRRRCGGTVLVLVLAVGSIVGIIGLSSMLAIRVQHRAVQLREDAARAQLAADSALHVIHTRLSTDGGWRSGHVHGQWSAAEDWGRGLSVAYRLLDEGPDADADLADDEADPARLVVRVTRGQAVRLASVRVGGEPALGPELITNGDLEAGTSGYYVDLLSGQVRAYTDYPFVGSTYLQYQNRPSSSSGLHQNLDGKIESGKRYLIDAWVRCGASNEYLTVGLHYPALLNSGRTVGVTALVDRYQWTRVRGVIQPSYTSYTSMRFFLSSSSSSQDLHLGQLSLREVLGGSLPVTAGSYRRELDQ